MKVRAWNSPNGPRVIIPLGGEELSVTVERATAIRDGIAAALSELETDAAARSAALLELLNRDEGV